MYVIKRDSDGAYVARSGAPSSYTRALQFARAFRTWADAEREVCPGNEVIVEVNTEIGGY